jgi:2-(1,2-epoxy-1,2-dihydrophenyl)acetyl-CoA isomerase
LDAAVDELADKLANGPTVAIGLTKSLLNAGYSQALEQQLVGEAFAMELSSRSPDFREGLVAFTERRDPKFEGR